MSTPIAGITATRAGRALTESALPWAPVVADDSPAAGQGTSPLQFLAVALRSVAQRTERLADRLDPACA